MSASKVFVFGAVVAMLWSAFAPTSYGDCCKIPVPPCQRNDNPPPDPSPNPTPNPSPNPSPNPTPNTSDNSNPDSGGGIAENSTNDPGTVDPSQGPSTSELLDKYAALGGFFDEEQQQAVIGWNGKEEVLVLTTNEKSLVGETAFLSVMPLPGKPHDITHADKEIFKNAKKLVVSKLNLQGSGASLGLFMERQIGAHNLFVWRIDEKEDFATRIQAYLAKKYDGKAKALFTKKTLATIFEYYDRGFRFFAFDLVLMSPQVSTKEAIAYHFDSKFCYYPLAISKAGGKGNTVADLVVFTPGEITRLDGVRKAEITLLGGKSVEISQPELVAIDSTLAGLFPADKPLRGRVLLIPGKLEAFTHDLVAR